jgi:aquaporin Z
VFAGTESILQLWLFILAPLLGAVVAGLAHPMLFGRGSDPVPGSGLDFGRPVPAAVPGYGAPDQYQQQWNQQDPPAQQSQQNEQAWTFEEAAAQGWHWDAQAQQWRHVSEGSPQATAQPAHEQQGWAPEQPHEQWPDPSQGDGRTQIRPPQGH